MRLFPLILAATSVLSVVSFAEDADKPAGLERYEAKDWQGAIDAFAPVLAGDPKNETALFYTGKAILQQERFEDALPYFKRLTDAYPDNANYWMWLGRAAGLSASRASVFRAKHFVNILKDAFGKALELDPDNGPTHIALVQFYAEAPFIVGGSMRKSRKEAEAAEKAGKAYGEMAWGIYYTYEEEYEDALVHLKAACDADIHEGMAYVFLGRTYAALGQRDKAIAALKQTFEQDDGASFAREELAKLGVESD